MGRDARPVSNPLQKSVLVDSSVARMAASISAPALLTTPPMP
jgi:hypothetical protein